MWRLFSSKKKSSKIIFDQGSIWAKKAVQGLPFVTVDHPKNADLIWTILQAENIFSDLLPNQLVNHIPNEGAMVDKGRLLTHLTDFDLLGQVDIKLNTFLPESYRLFIPAECQRFRERLPRKNLNNEPWILKPTNLSRGRGVVIFSNYDDIREFCEHPHQNLYDFNSNDHRNYIIQKYIKDVLLLDERKSEARVYWLIASIDPLLVLIYKKGTIRLNSLPFKLDDFDNQLIHITNVFQQKNHAFYDPNLLLKWDFLQLDEYIAKKFFIESYIDNIFLPRVKNCLAFVIEATKKELLKKATRGLVFGLYGADFIIDKDLNPWLTEVQIGPGLGYKDPIKKMIIPKMVQDTFKILFEVQKRKRENLPFDNFNDIGDFSWVIGPHQAG